MNDVENLNGKKIFITGGTGFFGKNLLETLAQNRSTAQLVILSRDPERFNNTNPEFQRNLNLEFIKGDIRDFQFPNPEFQYIIHGATEADAGFIQAHPEEMYNVITGGTRHLLEFAGLCPSPRLLYISSGAVYGRQPDTLPAIPETFRGIPENAYGRGKLDAETLCLKSNTTCSVARCFAFSGRWLPLEKQYALGNFIGDVRHDRNILVKGDGRTVRSYLDASDLSRWLLLLLQSAPDGEIFNLGSDRAITILELAETVRRISGTEKPVLVQQEWDGKPPRRYVPDLSKAKGFGLRETVTLEESIRKMLELF